MPASLPTLDQMTGARAGDYLLDSKPIDTSEAVDTLRAAQAVYELAMRQNLQAEVDLSQEGNPPMVYNSTAQPWPDASRAHADTSTLHYSQNLPVTEHGGFLNEGYERVQSFRGEELNSGISEHNASRHQYHQNSGDSSLGNDPERVLLTFPEGEADAVTITERDMEGLQPTRFLSDNIIDFYIKYLERRLSSEDRNRFYFFNSFFFTKLLGNSSASADIGQCKVEYAQVRKWSGVVNLFEKDYVFIPVLRSSHWSLIIICHLSSISSSPEKRRGSPCIFHLDPVDGKHESFEGQVRSYILQAWMEKYQASDNMEQLLALCQMKYVPAKVPQQDNGYDCGLYLLQYVENFILESNSRDFSFASSKGGPHLISPHFAGEVSAKRMEIHKLILERSGISQEQAAKRMDIQKLSQELRHIYQKLWMCLDGGAISGGRIEVVQSNGVSVFHTQNDESKHAVHLSTRGLAMDNNHQQCLTETEQTDRRTTWELAIDTKPLDGVEIAHAEYQSAGDVTLERKRPEKLPCAVLPNPSKGTSKRGRKWTEDETSVLLNCKVEGGRFCKGNQAATRWDIISQEIEVRLGTMPSEDQCRLRYDTLLKAYKTIKNYCLRTGKPFSEITEEERRELKLATTLSEEWYEAIDDICRRWPHKSKSQKRVKLSPSDGNGLLSLSPSNPAPLSPPASAPVPGPISAPALIPSGGCKPENSSRRQIAIPGFSTLDEDLRSTLLNLIQASSRTDWFIRDRWKWRDLEKSATGFFWELEVICERLAFVQDRKPSEIRRFVRKLSELKLVNIEFKNKIETEVISEEVECLKLWDVRVYKKFVEKVLCKNPDFKTFLRICDTYDSVSFPMEPFSSSLQRIRVLSLYECRELEHADLSFFPELRYLAIDDCDKLKAVTGWEVVKELGWLRILDCESYRDFPCVQCLPPWREFCFESSGPLPLEIIPVPDFIQCVPLRRLEIRDKYFWGLNSIDLSTLRFLEDLTCEWWSGYTTIHGLSGLHFLTKLEIRGCKALRRLPELGCLKALTHLNLSRSGVEEISGVQNLHFLTALDLTGCDLLKRLPRLGHLKALAHLDISRGGVDEIRGVQDLVSLETLDCRGSRLKWLPDLHHLPRLRWVRVFETPLSRTDPSSFYYGERDCFLSFNCEEERMGCVDDMSDISDTEYLHSDDDDDSW